MSAHDMLRRPEETRGPAPPLRAAARWSAAGRPGPLVAVAGLVAVVLIAACVMLVRGGGAAAPVTVTASRGDVEEVVTAIGSLQPFGTVDVGAQVTGQLKKL